MKKVLSVCLVLFMIVLTMTACGKENVPAEKAKKKVALLLSGPANDQGWNATAVDGLNAIKDKFGLDTTYQENVQIADMEAAFSDYANQGYFLVIGHGFQFGEPAAKVSANFPEQFFMATESNSKTKNMSSFVMSCEQGAYLMGTLAAMMTKTKVIGVVGGIEQPSITKELEAFKLGAKKEDPEVTVLSAYCNSFTDVTAGQSAATAMINQRADVLYHVANQAGTGVIKACEEKNLYCLGNSYDQSSIAPKVILASTVYNLPNVIVFAYESILNNQFGNAVVPLGIKEKVVDISFNEKLNDVIGQENIDRINKMKDEICNGTLDVPVIETPTK